MGREIPKQYLPISDRPLIWYALATLCAVGAIEKVFVVLSPDDEFWPEAQMLELGSKLMPLRCGGATRAESVTNGLDAMTRFISDLDHCQVLVHDAARPCLTVALVEKLIHAVGNSEAGGILAIPVADTLKRAYRRDKTADTISETLARDHLWQAQTPQMFRHGVLRQALRQAPQVTDEASAVEALGLHPMLVEADSLNIKVTYPHDLALAALILGQRSTT